MARLYAVDAVHEFPFTRPGVPSRLEGREAILEFVIGSWRDLPLKYERYHTLSILDTTEPNTIVVEQEAIGKDRAGRAFTLPNIVVLTVRGGQIAHLRDYVNLIAVAEAVGTADS